MPHCNLDGVRNFAATRAANAGASENEIASILAQKDTPQAAVYTR